MSYLENKIIVKEPINLYTPIQYILEIGGKRLRPVLTILTCDLYDGNHHIKEHAKISEKLSTKILNGKMEIKKETIETASPKELVDYCLNPDLMEKCIFMQVYQYLVKIHSVRHCMRDLYIMQIV